MTSLQEALDEIMNQQIEGCIDEDYPLASYQVKWLEIIEANLSTLTPDQAHQFTVYWMQAAIDQMNMEKSEQSEGCPEF